MTEDIKIIKAKILQFMDQEVGKYGNGRMDVKQIGELADVIKDLAEAEYYCTVAESMTKGQESMGYTQPTSGNMRSGYGMMGHSDPLSSIREMMMTADPETKAMLRSEMTKLL